jgi:cytochrome b involved in lipid metabolism
MEKDIKFKSEEEMKQYAEKNNALLVVFDGYVLDATSFAKHHPGGMGLILNYSRKDVTDVLNSHQPLSLIMANSMVIGTFEKEIKRLINPDQALLPQIWGMDH